MAANIYDDAIEQLPPAPAPAAAPPSAPKPNPYEAVIDTLDAGNTQALKTSLVQASSTPPDRAADIQRLSTKTGIAPDIIERNFDAIQKRALLTDTPYAQMLRETPAVASWASEPTHAAVAHDDMENLGALEWLLKAPTRAFAQGMDSTRYSLLRAESLTRDLTPDEQTQLNNYKIGAQSGGELGAGNSWFRGAVTGLMKNLPMLFGAGLYANKFGMAGAAEVGAAGALAGSVLPGAGTAAGFMTGAGTGYAAGALYGGFEFARKLAAGQAYDEFSNFKDELGRPLDPTVAKVAAQATGYINGALMTGGFKLLAETVPGADKLAGLLTTSAVKQALLQPTMRAALLEAATTFGKTLTFETANMVAQRAAQILVGDVAKESSGQPFTIRDAGDTAADLGQTALGALRDFALLTAAGPAAGFAIDRVRAREALHNATFFQALGEGVAQSKTAQRLPEALQTVLAAATKDGPVETVYAPIESWSTYWQSKGVDPAEIAARVTGDPQAFDRATRTGEDLAIPTAKYATTLAATEHNAFFANELRLAPEQMNAREAQAFEQNIAAQQQAEADATKAAAVHEAAAPVRENITRQLEAAGVERSTAESYATLYEHAFQTLGERAGIDPVDLFNRYGLTIERPELKPDAQAGEVALDQQPRPEFVPVGGEDTENADRLALQQTEEQRRAEIAATGETDPAKAALREATQGGKARVLYQSPAATESKAFRDWFGESQAVKEDGTPIVVYHGSNKRFSVFENRETKRNVDGRVVDVTPQAFFFSEDRGTSKAYAKDRALIDERLRGKKPGRPEVRAFHLSVQNPLDFTGGPGIGINTEALSLVEHLAGYSPETWNDVQAALDDPHLVEQLRDLGYDGARLQENDGSTTWAVFDPEQVKSVNNRGTFDPSDPNVFHQGERGFIRISADRQLTIGLLKGADRSTFLHESGHGFLEVMRDLAKEPGADEHPRRSRRARRTLLRRR
jgi:hypothetical protein